jgi:nitrogen regulatory protein PII-like uncharacterized protein
MKHLKTYESFVDYIGMLPLAAPFLIIAGPKLYDRAKKLWSKHITSMKYEKTGKKEYLETPLYGKGKMTKILIEQYKDKSGKLYWGYEHQYAPEQTIKIDDSDPDELYTAMFKEEDLGKLKAYFTDKYTNKKPEAVDMIYRKVMDNPGLSDGRGMDVDQSEY